VILTIQTGHLNPQKDAKFSYDSKNDIKSKAYNNNEITRVCLQFKHLDGYFTRDNVIGQERSISIEPFTHN
jgi:hypothetical protein